jgi:hypothetical protein
MVSNIGTRLSNLTPITGFGRIVRRCKTAGSGYRITGAGRKRVGRPRKPRTILSIAGTGKRKTISGRKPKLILF